MEVTLDEFFDGHPRVGQVVSQVHVAQLDQARGINKALMKMVDAVVNDAQHVETKTLAVSHCNCPERAAAVKARIEKLANFKKIIIINTAGVSSMYANDGGVIVAV